MPEPGTATHFSSIAIGVGNARITDLRMLNQLAGVRPRQLVLIVADTDGTHYVLIQ